MRTILYGAGFFLSHHKGLLPKDMEVVAYADSMKYKTTQYTGKLLDGKPVFSLEEVEKADFDKLIICTDAFYADQIYQMLKGSLIPPQKVMFLYREQPVVYQEKLQKWNYQIFDDWSIESRIGDVVIQERGGTDHVTISEIFYENCYHTNISSGTVVIDMGMNIGVASLYFAGMKEVEAVYGFEPFPDTYNCACKNIGINPKYIREKITTYNLAVSDKNEEKNVSVLTDYMGWRGINNCVEEYPTIKIQCNKADDLIRDIVERHKGKRFLLKIDTEGSEYPIFEVLNCSGMLSRMDMIVMEYHASPMPLIETLTRNGFLYSLHGTSASGLITGFRK